LGEKIIVFATSFLDELTTHPADEGRAADMLKEAAQRHGLELEFRCHRNPSEPLREEELEDAVAVIADLERYDAELLRRVGPAAGGSLRIISRYGTGYTSVDTRAAAASGITVCNTPGANAHPTAEWAVATLLDIAGRRIPHHERAKAGLRKSGPSRLDVTGKTLGIVGTGHIGKKIPALMAGFEMKILAHSRTVRDDWARRHHAQYVDLARLCREADFITLHASCGEELIGEAELALMKPTTVLVNCARGLLVDNRAAYRAVKEGRLWGYGIDEVWDYPDLPLEGLNIAASPHVGSDSDQGKIGMQLMSAQAVVDFLDGRRPEHVVN